MNSSFHKYLEFLEFYLQGILSEGLLIPLRNFSARRLDDVGTDAALFFQFQMDGRSPQDALKDLKIKMPQALKEALVLGFEKSTLDLVLADTIQILKSKNSEEETESALSEILKKYKKIDTTLICIGCAKEEISKIFARAEAEGVKEVIIQQKGEFIVQKYLGPKLVTVIEASIPGVYESLKEALKNRKDRIQIIFQ
ncbi:hypothetical protein AZI86_06675 [Bdellovibrio bacteriovorus]|uniref:Uncharacterized protein n=1 Tax=Bdellovibrio bacteriovorus TaxID=959 RepID=A0A150WQF1_BDEBC|nr:hypothetical protein [Bdellovibrio bacteriovorus]KYG66723.1 hypothetical protein AZI86_06675 [Bdellovibrio bacteriovorus]